MINQFDFKNFTSPDANISHYDPTKNPFNFKNKNSKKLLVTIGDSWTWGDELTNRIDNCYGNILSDMINADWLNLAVPGAGNHYIGQLYLDFIAYINKNNAYEHIICIVILTETARDFNGWFDRNVDYAHWLRNNIKEHNDYNKFLELINDFSIDQIISNENTVDNLELLIGFNFVNPSSIQKLSSLLIEKTWLEVVTNTAFTNKCYFLSSYIFDKLESIFSIEYSLDRAIFRQWQIEQLEKVQERVQLVSNSEYFYPRTHPNESQHIVWAEYLYKELKNRGSKSIS